MAGESFRPVTEALALHAPQGEKPWQWCRRADPEDPSGQLLKTLDEIHTANPVEMAGQLRKCISQCQEQGDVHLEREAHYLLGLVLLAQAEDGRISGARSRELQREAETALSRSGSFDPASPEVLFWRDGGQQPASPKLAREALRQLKVNPEHFLIQLYGGLTPFSFQSPRR